MSAMTDAPRLDLCACGKFVLWYEESTEEAHSYVVCRCGHRDVEHLDGHGSCTGKIEVI